MTNIPEWAKQRACDLWSGFRRPSKFIAFARYIAEHEKAPVDPLLIEAREIVQSYYPEMPSNYTGRRAAIALKANGRGIELGKEGVE